MPRRPPQLVLREPSWRTYTDWSPDTLRAAQLLADAGSMRLAADLCDAVQADDRVRGCLLQVTRGLLGLELGFEDGAGRRRRRARKALEAEQDFHAAFAEDALAQLLTWGALLGVGLGELRWSDESGRQLPYLHVWHPRWLRFDWPTRQWFVRTEVGEVLVTPGDGTWVLFTPDGAERPWVHGAWRAVARWWLLKQFATSDWGRYSEQAGGIRVATTEDGSQQDREKLAQDLSDAGTDASIALPAKWDLKLVTAPATTHETFVAQVDAANSGIAISLCGQNLSSEVKGGSYAAAAVHQAVAEAILRGLAEALSTCLREQALVWWAEFNFGARDVAPWPCWDTDPPEDLAARAGTQKTGMEALALALQAGVNVDARAYAESLGFPVLEGEPAPKPTPKEASPEGEQLAARRRRRADPRGPLLAGQLYVDDVLDAHLRDAPKAAEPMLAPVLEALALAKDYDDLRQRLAALRVDLDETRFRGLLQSAVSLAGYAGRWSAQRERE